MSTERDQDLDFQLAELKAQSLTPSDDLLHRIMGDADGVLSASASPVVPSRRSIGAVLLDVIGGWPSFGGLAAATLAGIWIGISPPDGLASVSAGLLGDRVEVPVLGDAVLVTLEGGL